MLTVPAGATPDPALLAALTEYAATTPGTELARLADLAATTDVMELPGGQTEVVRLPATAGIDLGERVDRINLTRLSAAGAGSMLVDQAPADAWHSELDDLVSTSLDDDTVDARLGTINAAIEAVHACVALPEPFTFTLTGRSSVLRLNLTNTCDEDLRVVVHPDVVQAGVPERRRRHDARRQRRHRGHRRRAVPEQRDLGDRDRVAHAGRARCRCPRRST